MIPLQQRARVYTTADTGTGTFTHLVKDGLACRLTIAPTPVLPPDDRAADLPRTRLLWEAGYSMPSPAQVEIDGERWTVRAGSEDAIKGPFGSVVYRRADVAQAVL